MADRTARADLAVVKAYGWYIDNALRYKIDSMQKAVDDAKNDLPNDARWQGIRNMIEEVEFRLRDYREAHEALKAIDIK